MTLVDEFSPEWRVEDDELVQRLRNLEWAHVQPELRDRCWKEFSQRIKEKKAKRHAEVPGQTTNLGERYDFRRFHSAARLSVAQAASRPHRPRTAFSVS